MRDHPADAHFRAVALDEPEHLDACAVLHVARDRRSQFREDEIPRDAQKQHVNVLSRGLMGSQNE
ncbi:MAG: hypothetical protein HY047_02755 [Acidobacteria bacterium]|nr:hypothetical protein [Acidobacteriota bacterium]